jgi:hypothetical protein
VPRFSRTPGRRSQDEGPADATAELLAEVGLGEKERLAVAEEARQDGAFGLKWPPD